MGLRAIVAIVALLGVWWMATRPSGAPDIAPPYAMSAPPAAIAAVAAARDDIAYTVTRSAFALPGYDDVVLQEERGRAFATGVDGWMWTIDLATGTAERLLDVPLMPAGARAVPGDPDHILFCAARHGGRTNHPGQAPGVYELTISTPAATEVAVRVPRPPPVDAPPAGNEGTVLTGDAVVEVPLASLGPENSRPVAFCNDLDVSGDGRFVYFSEPFDRPDAGMGPAAVPEAIRLGENGRLWRIDRTRDTIALIAYGYTFLDGVLLEPGPDGHPRSVLITETPKFRILRLHLAGARAGTDEILWDSLPGMPDGLDRDPAGRIWVGLYGKRTAAVTWVHGHPWIKPLLLRLPPALMPVSHDTGILVLDSEGRTPRYYVMHDGSRVREISTVVPGTDRLYLPSFALDNRGLVTMPYPAPLARRR